MERAGVALDVATLNELKDNDSVHEDRSELDGRVYGTGALRSKDLSFLWKW